MMTNEVMRKSETVQKLEKAEIDPIIQTLCATIAAKSTEAYLQRTYLENISIDSNTNQPYLKIESDNLCGAEPHWIRIDQVGKPLEKDTNFYIDALQRILQYAHKPNLIRLLYLIVSDGNTNDIYLGIKSLSGDLEKDLGENFGQFIKSNWGGTSYTVCSESNHAGLGLKLYRDMLSNNPNANRKTIRLNSVYALSGLPASISKDKNNYSATIDKLLNGMTGTPFAYLVIADPIPANEVHDMLFQYRELSSKAESLKTINYTESFQEGLSESFGESFSQFMAETETKGTSKRSAAGTATALATAGISLITTAATAAAMIFPPAILVAGGGFLASTILSSLQGAFAQKSSSISKTNSQGKTETYNISVSSNVTKSLAKTLVNKHIASVVDNLDYQIQRYNQSLAYGCWDARCYLLTPSETETERAALQIRSLLSGENSSYEPVRIHKLSGGSAKDIQTIFEGFHCFQPPLLLIMSDRGESINHPLGSHYDHVNLPVNTRELSMLINFPVNPTPGMNIIETCNEFAMSKRCLEESSKTVNEKNVMHIGDVIFGGTETNVEFIVDADELTKHALICGINGSGKSNTCRKILTSLLAAKHDNYPNGIPFLVIEPAKDEYVEWAMRYNSQAENQNKINIWMPGATHWRNGVPLNNDFTLNPFDILVYDHNSEPAVLEHIDRLKTIINASLPMQEVLPILMEELIYRVYDVPIYSKAQKAYVKWLSAHNCKVANEHDRRPSFLQAKTHVRKMVSDKGYHERISMDLSAALMTRLDSFCRGWRKELFNSEQPTATQWRSIFSKPTVINLTKLASDDDKAFVMAVLISFLYEYRLMELIQGGTLLDKPELRHLLVVEEAHRVLSSEQSLFSSGNPKVKLAEMFSNLLSEVRAYGQGVLIVDQVPTRLIPDAIKNTNLKLVHRLVADDDKDAVGACMNLSNEQKKILGKLKQGQMIACGNNDDIAYWVKVRKDS